MTVYVLDCLNAPDEHSWRVVDDNSFKTESIRQKKVYSVKGFQEAFNDELINSNVDLIRII